MRGHPPGLAEAADQPSERIARFFGELADLIDRRPALVLPVWIVAYFTVLWKPAHRPLWYDELFTYYVSMSPTLDRFMGSVLHVDLNPPLGYVFVRASIALFGDTPFTARFPMMLAFLAASLVASYLISRRLGGAFGLVALGIFWSFSITRFAVELRAYAFILVFFCTAALCWLNALESRRWSIWHTGLALALGAMFLTHCFSPPYAAAIGVGELVRTLISRRIDKRVWIALLAPLCVLPLYIPLVRTVKLVLTPHAFEATPITIPTFYLGILAPLLIVLGAMLLAWLVGRGRGAQTGWRDWARPHEIAFAVAAFFSPVVTMSYCIWSKVPFWPRHGSGAILGGTLILTALLAVITKRNSNAAVASAGLILILFCFTKAGTGRLMTQFENTSTSYRTILPDLPFVTASGLTFLEMDHRESPEFIDRLYALTDGEAAVRYHSNIFEWLPILRQWFPVRARVEPYREFINHNRRFLVLATAGYPEDWLLPQLQADGAQIRLLQDQKTGYKDHELYQVDINLEDGDALPVRYYRGSGRPGVTASHRASPVRR